MYPVAAAEELRKKLREKGWSSRKVSVRSDEYSIHVVIKDDSVDGKEVARLAYAYEEIDRDEHTGEVLLGGNTYVFVEDAKGRTIRCQ